nr:MAG TPA: hypothetical protein [Caudoviricetes sp.]
MQNRLRIFYCEPQLADLLIVSTNVIDIIDILYRDNNRNRNTLTYISI